MTRWLFLLQEFDIIIVDRPNRENVVAEFLSHLNAHEYDSPVDDSFHDEHLFAVSAHSPLYADISNSPHLSHREKINIIQQSVRFSWIGSHLFYIGMDQEIRRCVRKDEVYGILKDCHDGPCQQIGHNIL